MFFFGFLFDPSKWHFVVSGCSAESFPLHADQMLCFPPPPGGPKAICDHRRFKWTNCCPAFYWAALQLHFTNGNKSLNHISSRWWSVCHILVFDRRGHKSCFATHFSCLEVWKQWAKPPNGHLNIVKEEGGGAADGAARTPCGDFVKGDPNWNGQLSQLACLVHINCKALRCYL